MSSSPDRVKACRTLLDEHTAGMDLSLAGDREKECTLLANYWRELSLRHLDEGAPEQAIAASKEHDRHTQNAIRWNRQLQTDLLRAMEAEVEAQRKASAGMHDLRRSRMAVVGEAE